MWKFQVFYASAPTRVAANWFPSNQVSTATSLGIFGSLLGVALGFYIPPIAIKNHENLDKIGEEMQLLNYIYSGITTVTAVLVVICEFSWEKLFKTIYLLFLKNIYLFIII